MLSGAFRALLAGTDREESIEYRALLGAAVKTADVQIPLLLQAVGRVHLLEKLHIFVAVQDIQMRVQFGR